MIARDGRKIRRAYEQWWIRFRIRSRQLRRLQNVWRIAKNINFAEGIDPKTGELDSAGRGSVTRQSETRHSARRSPVAVSWNFRRCTARRLERCAV